jgi:hypothetical protein
MWYFVGPSQGTTPKWRKIEWPREHRLRSIQYILVPEDHPAFRNKKAAIRDAKKRWAAQEPAERIGHFIAKVESYLEPDYEIKFTDTPISQMEED